MFENISFKGQFRTYQQKILDNADIHLKDGRINIVAAPGSGKTILGLELIMRLASPCIILSPTTTIRNQWGERFDESFASEQEYFSNDLTKLKPITSVTYQALYCAMKKIKDEDIDYTSFDIIEAITQYGVKTLCLDEAHHLQNEWQKALEAFVEKLGNKVKIIALTATPPYDASPAEWKRYIKVCGEIDEEILVPELVKQNTLCPHQDFVYFNYPTLEETKSFEEYRTKVNAALGEFIKKDIFIKSFDRATELFLKDSEFVYANVKNVVALLSLYQFAGMSIDKNLIRAITAGKGLPKENIKIFETAVNFLINNILDEEAKQEALSFFKKYGLYQKGEIYFDLNPKLKNSLLSSVGKLKSIFAIVKSEYDDRRENLRMLILTDYIRKENLSFVGTDKDPDKVSLVSVFETVRRTGVKVGAVSGSLIILPKKCAQFLWQEGVKFSEKDIENTSYCVFDISADNKVKVKIAGKLFENGVINVLVGTKSLLGEGWDAPCINSLILASFVGSFMLSNQMRGRAIRKDVNQPEKVANIWHLITLERRFLTEDKIGDKISALTDEDKNKINSYDFETVGRRFSCFVAPDYQSGEITSGIERISIIKPPFDEKGIENINKQMLALSRDHKANAEAWNNSFKKSSKLNEVSDVPKQRRIPPFLFVNLMTVTILLTVFSSMFALIINIFARNIETSTGVTALILAIALLVMAGVFVYVGRFVINKILKHLNPTKSLQTLAMCVKNAMEELGLISPQTQVKTESEDGVFVHIELINASVHDQNLFHTAIGEMLSPIENPRYIIVAKRRFIKNKYNCRLSLACPEILGKRNEYAECLAKYLTKSLGKLEVVFTRSEKGRKLMLECKRKSYITQNEQYLTGRRKRISHWE